VKKGRHRRFEEARKLKQQGPGAFLPSEPNGRQDEADAEELDDEFSDIAARYGAFDDDDEPDDET
jgi:hypothetical protein